MKVIALGSEMGGDDAAALIAARELDGDVILAGRPGPSLIDLFEPGVPIVLLDVVRRGAVPGAIVEMELQELLRAGTSSGRASSHDLGPIEALRLAQALGRPLPEGRFVGLGGKDFRPGAELSPEVRASLPAFVDAARRALTWR